MTAAAFATRLEDEGSVGVSVEIAPRETVCTVGCTEIDPGETPPLPQTGSEPVSVGIAIALVVAGLAALAWARRRPRDAR